MMCKTPSKKAKIIIGGNTLEYSTISARITLTNTCRSTGNHAWIEARENSPAMK